MFVDYSAEDMFGDRSAGQIFGIQQKNVTTKHGVVLGVVGLILIWSKGKLMGCLAASAFGVVAALDHVRVGLGGLV